jgi:hypothetical protein
MLQSLHPLGRTDATGIRSSFSGNYRAKLQGAELVIAVRPLCNVHWYRLLGRSRPLGVVIADFIRLSDDNFEAHII